MAITGTFLANFDQFNAAVTAAGAKLVTFEGESAKADASLKAIGTNFNIEDTIANPLGVAKEALTAFADTLGPIAPMALGAVTAVIALGTAIYELAANAAAVGGQLNDMSEKTGMSVPALAKMSLAAQVAGTDLGALTSALFMFEKNMAEATPKFLEGLDRLGLTMSQVKAAGVDNYLSLVAHAMTEQEDPSQRAAAAVELFNKQGREIIPTLMKLDDALLATNDIAPWTTQQAADAEKFEMQMTSMKVHAEAFGTSIGRELIGPVAGLVLGVKDAVVWVNNFVSVLRLADSALTGGLGGKLQLLASGLGYASIAVDVFRGKVEAMPTVTGPAAAGVAALHPVIDLLATKQEEAARVAALQVSALHTLALEMEEAKRAAAALAKAQAEADALTMAAYQAQVTSLETIEAQRAKSYGTAEQLVMLSQLDAAEQALARSVYAQITSEKDRLKIVIDAGKQHEAITLAKMGLEQKLTTIINAGVIEAMGVQIAFNKSIGLDAMGAIAIQETALTRLTARLADIAAMHTTEAAQLTLSAAAERTYTQALYDEAVAQDAASAALAKANALLDEAAKKKADAANAQHSLVGGHVMSEAEFNAYYQTPQGIADMIRNGGKRYHNDGGAQPVLRDAGGPVTAGRSYLVGTGAQPELFTPASSGFMTPARGGATSITINLYGTPESLAQQVKTIVLRDVLQGRKV
ncbi:MAG TPA: hypothetical protein VGP77_13075 [Vicinamibacterales bacterium]|jgi:hypothetical protein|nr:hypothetical protein [Vicinamibacterales bacterium]